MKLKKGGLMKKNNVMIAGDMIYTQKVILAK